MAQSALVLGTISFRDFEIPECIAFGGRQTLAVQQLIGGGRVVDVLGRDDDTISFSGTFVGPDATARARALDAMRVAGQELPLVWDVFYYTVVIASLKVDYLNPWWIPFRVVCAVVRDEASSPLLAAVPVLQSLISDIGYAAEAASQAGFDLSAQQSSIAAAGATAMGSAAYLSTTSAVAVGYSQLLAARDAAGAAMEASVASVTSGTAVSAAGLVAAGSAAQNVALLSSAAGYLGRANANLLNAST